LTIGEHSRILDELIETFNAHGYEVVVPYSVLNAADFGVPQDRRRLFLMGAKKGLRLQPTRSSNQTSYDCLAGNRGHPRRR